MNPKPLKVKVSITLDSNLVEKIKEMADEDDRNFSQYINYVLKDWIKRQPDKEAKDWFVKREKMFRRMNIFW